MEDSSDTYKAGVCNIGPAEIARRRLLGWSCAIITVAAGVILILFEFPALWRLILVIPASLSAGGFIQARAKFCAGFGMFGIFNMSLYRRRLVRVKDRDFQASDRRKAMIIMLWSALAGGIVAVGAYAV